MVISELLVSNSVDDVLFLYKRTRFKNFQISNNFRFPKCGSSKYGSFQRSMTERYTDLKTFSLENLILKPMK